MMIKQLVYMATTRALTKKHKEEIARKVKEFYASYESSTPTLCARHGGIDGVPKPSEPILKGERTFRTKGHEATSVEQELETLERDIRKALERFQAATHKRFAPTIDVRWVDATTLSGPTQIELGRIKCEVTLRSNDG